MKRGQHILTPMSQKEQRGYVSEFFEWVYSKEPEPHRVQFGFWDWYLGISDEQRRGKGKKDWQTIMRGTAKWDWIGFRQDIRKLLGRELALWRRTKQRRPLVVERTLGAWKGPDGRWYFHYGPPVPKTYTAKDMKSRALDEALSFLSGSALETVAQCPECGRYFIRLRAKRKVYCSPVCSWQAFQARRKAKKRAKPSKGKKAPARKRAAS